MLLEIVQPFVARKEQLCFAPDCFGQRQLDTRVLTRRKPEFSSRKSPVLMNWNGGGWGLGLVIMLFQAWFGNDLPQMKKGALSRSLPNWQLTTGHRPLLLSTSAP